MRATPSLLSLILLPVLACQPTAGASEATVASQGAEACPVRESVQPSARLPYSAAVRSGGNVFFSGKIGATEETRAMTEGRVAAETRNIMEAFRALFEEMDMGFEDVVKGVVYLDDIEAYGEMNGVYGEYFQTDPPARVALSVDKLPGSAALEISFVSVCR